MKPYQLYKDRLAEADTEVIRADFKLAVGSLAPSGDGWLCII
jgi:hypothetical protein